MNTVGFFIRWRFQRTIILNEFYVKTILFREEKDDKKYFSKKEKDIN